MQMNVFQNQTTWTSFAFLFLILALIPTDRLRGQDRNATTRTKTEANPIVISDQPVTVDPATLLSPRLAAPVTVKFADQPLKELFTWLRRDQSLNVVIDFNEKLQETEPYTDELNDLPLYLLLNRLENSELAWYEQDDTIMVTSMPQFLARPKDLVSYQVGDLFDAGYTPTELLKTITECSGGIWNPAHARVLSDASRVTDNGTATLLGDVVLVRQNPNVHREIAGLLAALRHHGRRTFAFDAPQNAALRAAIQQPVTVDFEETPLNFALQDLSRKTGILLRLDHLGLAGSSANGRTPVTLKVEQQKLRVVLQSMLGSIGLSWYYRDAVIWVGANTLVRQIHKTAIFDVRDLCHTQEESVALMRAIQTHFEAKWSYQNEIVGSIQTPVPGVLVVRHNEKMLDEILQLLDVYRSALRVSKLREVAPLTLKDPKEVVTGYYRLQQPLADEIQKLAQTSIFPESWKTEARPLAVGSIQKVPVQRAAGELAVTPLLSRKPETTPPSRLGEEIVVLIIRQTREAHQAIGKLIRALNDATSIDVEATQDTELRTSKPAVEFGKTLIPPRSE